MIINNKIRKLSELSPGEEGVVHAIAPDHSVSERLMEMGLIEGTKINFVRRAPLGDPLEITLHGYHLSLRKTEADLVEIEVG